MLRRFFSICLFTAFLIFTAVSLSPAMVIDPNLQTILLSTGADGDVSVIITLPDKADISSISDLNKNPPRSKIVNVVMNKANITQGPVRTFVQSVLPKRRVPLWIISIC